MANLTERVNYKTVESLDAAIKESCPNGVGIFFDNVRHTLLLLLIAIYNNNNKLIIIIVII